MPNNYCNTSRQLDRLPESDTAVIAKQLLGGAGWKVKGEGCYLIGRVESKGIEGIESLGGGNSNIFYLHPYLGKISNLTNIFQTG